MMMKKFKKITAITLVLVCSITNYAMAANVEPKQILSEEEQIMEEVSELTETIDYEAEFVRAEHGISDIPITNEMLEGCTATKTGLNGEVEELDVSATIRELGSITSLGEEKKVYAMTAYAEEKYEDGSDGFRNTRVYGTLVWLDNFGPNNELVSVSGSWVVGAGDTISDRSVSYGISNAQHKNSLTKYPTKNSFSYQGTSKMVGFVIFLEAYAKISGNSLVLRITSSFTS